MPFYNASFNLFFLSLSSIFPFIHFVFLLLNAISCCYEHYTFTNELSFYIKTCSLLLPLCPSQLRLRLKLHLRVIFLLFLFLCIIHAYMSATNVWLLCLARWIDVWSLCSPSFIIHTCVRNVYSVMETYCKSANTPYSSEVEKVKLL